jgi:hypothetical protein
MLPARAVAAEPVYTGGPVAAPMQGPHIGIGRQE